MFLLISSLQCSWGSKPTPPGIASTPLPPPAPAPLLTLSPADILAYERSIALSKMTAANQALLQAQVPHSLKQAAAGLGTGASQAIYDGGFQSGAAGQQLLYFQ